MRAHKIVECESAVAATMTYETETVKICLMASAAQAVTPSVTLRFMRERIGVSPAPRPKKRDQSVIRTPPN